MNLIDINYINNFKLTCLLNFRKVFMIEYLINCILNMYFIIIVYINDVFNIIFLDYKNNNNFIINHIFIRYIFII